MPGAGSGCYRAAGSALFHGELAHTPGLQSRNNLVELRLPDLRVERDARVLEGNLVELLVEPSMFAELQLLW